MGIAPPTDSSQGRPETDRDGWIHHTRVAVDYLLGLGNVPAAELVMENGRQQAGLRVLNQAWLPSMQAIRATR
ncbi:MAG: hypothetical protein HC915_16335 [Anaerolineae bacterium]|nr:hypothetical protein [Anaerolineae bacterium]